MKLDTSAPQPFPPRFASAWGDDEFGVWAEIAVLNDAPGSAVVIQRLRWIEPGEFQMGSPENESRKEQRECPRHRVSISQGFWLADTACTQSLWQTVMGANPSHFIGDLRCPVEKVSWLDVQEFLIRIGGQLTGVAADLPSEAQWEYACRAGTETAFSFGDQISSEQVNYDGNYPYAGSARGLFRERTMPVKSLPPNDWGLYECHGNVWEWCADGLRDYVAAAQRDPLGPGAPGDLAPRALRGGSWIGHAWSARSARRFAYLPANAYRSLGFRFCLKSGQPGPAR